MKSGGFKLEWDPEQYSLRASREEILPQRIASAKSFDAWDTKSTTEG